MTIDLREITEDNAQPVLALRCTPTQERFVTSVVDSLAEARDHGPWFLWKLLIDHRQIILRRVVRS